jgi:predicted nuclease of predicted toxin-antitoxin system
MGNLVELRFLTDEDVPRSTARVLRDAGFDVVDVRDVGLRGKSDQEVFATPSVKAAC